MNEQTLKALKVMRDSGLSLEDFINASALSNAYSGADFFKAAGRVFDTMAGYGLERFRKALDGDHYIAKANIAVGEKTACYMWYVFPQLKGLGRSRESRFFGIKDINEAKAFLSDKELRERLVSLTSYLMDKVSPDKLSTMYGAVDYQKLRSCFTLFALAYKSMQDSYNAAGNSGWGIEGADVFGKAINHFFSGIYCERTVSILSAY